jgi:hypothetical protein
MKRLCVTLLCLASAVAWTQASAESPSAGPLRAARPHAAKARTSEHAALKTASVGEIHFSDPYAPPVGAGKKSAAQFPTAESEEPSASPQGGFSLTAGREAPDAPFTGGLKLRF